MSIIANCFGCIPHISWNYQFMSLILEQRYLMYSYLLPYLVLSGGLTAIAQSLCTRILAAKRQMIFYSLNSLPISRSFPKYFWRLPC